MIVGVVTLASEAAIFVKIPPRQLLLGNLRLSVAYTVLAVALAYLPFGLKLYSAQGVVPAPRSMPKTALLVLGGGVAYLVLYFVFGGIFYQAFTKPYYMHQVVGGELLKEGETIARALGIWFPLIQIARGTAMVLAVLPIIRMLRLPRLSTAVIVGSVLWVVGGLAPLLVPNPVMPSLLRFYHLLEIFTQNFLLGVLATLMLRARRPVAANVATAT
jgi:hypothetical protein